MIATKRRPAIRAGIYSARGTLRPVAPFEFERSLDFLGAFAPAQLSHRVTNGALTRAVSPSVLPHRGPRSPVRAHHQGPARLSSREVLDAIRERVLGRAHAAQPDADRPRHAGSARRAARSSARSEWDRLPCVSRAGARCAGLGRGVAGDRTSATARVEGWLLAIAGIGPWSARFILLRGLGRMERIDGAEVAVGRTFARVYGDRQDPPAVERAAKRYGRWRGYWLHYLRAAPAGEDG